MNELDGTKHESVKACRGGELITKRRFTPFIDPLALKLDRVEILDYFE